MPGLYHTTCWPSLQGALDLIIAGATSLNPSLCTWMTVSAEQALGRAKELVARGPKVEAERLGLEGAGPTNAR